MDYFRDICYATGILHYCSMARDHSIIETILIDEAMCWSSSIVLLYALGDLFVSNAAEFLIASLTTCQISLSVTETLYLFVVCRKSSLMQG